jgi:hypothetical protein
VDEADQEKQRLETLRTQLKELNTRSRWYTTQLWQVPIAFIGIVGITVSRLPDETMRRPVLIILGLLGIAVLIHMYNCHNRTQRTVQALARIEESLGLEDRATYTGRGSISLVLMVLGITAIAFWAASR